MIGVMTTSTLIAGGAMLLVSVITFIVLDRCRSVSDGYLSHRTQHLPFDYRMIAFREARLYRQVGGRLTPGKVSFIVRVAERLAIEHGALQAR